MEVEKLFSDPTLKEKKNRRAHLLNIYYVTEIILVMNYPI